MWHLKVESILLGSLNQVHVFEFWVSQTFHYERLGMWCGACDHRSPTINHGGSLWSAIDAWSVGALFHVMVIATKSCGHGQFRRPLALEH